MEMRNNFNGKAIYKPGGKAAEYSAWACNFFVGCSNSCEYCYCKKGILAGAMGQDKPQLKKCFKNEDEAMAIFKMELIRNFDEIRKHGLFFSFTTDPCLPETWPLTWNAAILCASMQVPVKILTKCTEWINSELFPSLGSRKSLIAFGFTLTGHDELELNASTNQERIDAMEMLHDAGFKTFASIEPIIHLSSASKMIDQSRKYCDLFKIGLLSGKKFDKIELNDFVWMTSDYYSKSKIYFKDSLLKAAGITRDELPINCVSRNFNLFT